MSQAILFLNGNSHSHKSFRKQFQELKLKKYRLIAVDLPGHGNSSAIADYNLIELSNVINKFIEFLQLSQFIVVGHSLGGHVAIHLLNQIRPDGILTFGTPPLAIPLSMVGFLANANTAPLGVETANSNELDSLAKELRYEGIDKEILFEDYKKTDKNFRTQIFQSVGNGKYFNELELLKDYTGKCMTIISSEDKLVNNEYIAEVFNSNQSNVKFLNSGHSPQLEIADQFNEALLDFANSAFTLLNFKVTNIEGHNFNDFLTN